jgi:hypothetical protein
MSRSYGNDIGKPLWLQKDLGGRLEFASLEEIRSGKVREGAETAILDFECPAKFARDFLSLREERQHREIFRLAEEPEPPLQGTTWLAKDYCLGSANKSDFWVQRRPLIAYWGEAEDDASWLQLRLMKDDYDFSSALFFSVQERNCVLGFLNFRSPGGDKHVSLDPVKDGVFECSRLRWRVDLEGVADDAAMIVDGKPAGMGAEVLAGARIALELGGVYLWLRFPRSVFGAGTPGLSLAKEDGRLTVSLDLHRSEQPVPVSWEAVKEAWATVAMVMEEATGSLDEFSRKCAAGRFEEGDVDEGVRAIWHSPAGRLWLQGATGIAKVDEQNAVYRAGIGSGPVPEVRLSDERLAG